MRLVAAVLLLFAISPGTAAGTEEAALAKGRAAARALNETLRGRLVESMKGAGPAGAMAVCAYQARALASEVEREQGVKVKRTSLNLRNPGNAPDSFERELLVRLSLQSRSGSLPDEVFEEQRSGGVRVYRYAKPIVMGPACLACHGAGAEVSDEVRKMLKERYPEDAAMGYKAGDFRGIVSVVIEEE